MVQKKTLLVIEDDDAISSGLSLNLRHEGFAVSVQKNGEDGLREALRTSPDLILLDVMLPTMNGYEVLRELRRRKCQSGIILLTAKGLEEDKVFGLGLGADDYVQKPFGLAELIARVHAVLRRQQQQRPDILSFDDVVVDRGARSASKGGVEVELSPRESALLLYLLDHPGRAHTREQLLEGAWGMDYEGTVRTIDNFLVSLRKKLEVNPEKPTHFVTVRGVGYRFHF